MEANILMIEETSLFSVIMLMRALQYFTVHPLTPDKALHHRRDGGLTWTRCTAGSADDPEIHTGGLKGSQHRNFPSVLGVRGGKLFFDSEIPCKISALGRVLHVHKTAWKKNNLHSYSSILAIMLMSLAHVPLQSKKAYALFKAFN